jgi:cytochrome b561/polyisoprenoid-binding protein YceI
LSNTHYTNTAKILHWTIAAAIVLQFVLAKLADLAGDSDLAIRELALLANHKSVGITILTLALFRLVWRTKNPPPALPAAMPTWQVRASHFSHWALYGLIIVIPITGWLMSSASAYSVSWFNLFQLPDFVAPDPELKKTLKDIHETLAKILAVIALVHIGAALKHAMFDKDGVLSRMVSTVSVALFVGIIALGIAMLGQSGKQNVSPSRDTVVANATAVIDDGLMASSELPVWQIDYANSYIRFVGSQAGADFDGEWLSWSAALQFSSASKANGVFDVTVKTAEVNTNDQERDDVMSDPEWFDTRAFPAAFYRASSFIENADGSFDAQGQLIIKDVASPVVLRFTVDEQDGSRILIGHAEFKRLDLGVGVGEWEDTSWVDDEVRVNVRIQATLTD